MTSENAIVKHIQTSKLSEVQKAEIEHFLKESGILEQFQKELNTAEKLVVVDITEKDKIETAKLFHSVWKKARVEWEKKRKEITKPILETKKAYDTLFELIEKEIIPIEKHYETQKDFEKLVKEKQIAERKLQRMPLCEPYRNYFVSEFWNVIGEMGDELFNQSLETAKQKFNASAIQVPLIESVGDNLNTLDIIAEKGILQNLAQLYLQMNEQVEMARKTVTSEKGTAVLNGLQETNTKVYERILLRVEQM